MKSLLASIAILLSTHVSAEVFSIPSTGVSFNAPKGFSALSAQEIALKYPSNRPPRFVVGNAERSISIAFDIKDHSIPPEKLQEIKASFEQLFERIIPGIEWRDRSIVKISGQDWIRLEMTSRAVDTDIHNIMLVTPYRSKMLVFNFNSAKREFPAMRQELLKSVDSISIDG